MKKLTALVLALLMVLSIGAFTALAEEYVPGTYEIFVDDPRPDEQFVNVRAGLKRGESYEIILGQLWNGEIIEVIEVVNTDWGIINYDGKQGYVRLKYAIFLAPASSSEDPSIPESSEPEISEPESSEPEISEPESSEPESSEPESSEPESSEPESSEPESSEPESSEPEDPSDRYNVYGEYLYIPAGETAKEIVDYLSTLIEGEYAVSDLDGNALDDSAVAGTGFTANFANAGNEYVTIIVLGDVDGDGALSSTDYLKIKSYFLDIITLEGYDIIAADVDENGEIDSTDYLQLKSHFLGLIDIYA